MLETENVVEQRKELAKKAIEKYQWENVIKGRNL